jgi:hypothetical protein
MEDDMYGPKAIGNTCVPAIPINIHAGSKAAMVGTWTGAVGRTPNPSVAAAIVMAMACRTAWTAGLTIHTGAEGSNGQRRFFASIEIHQEPP